MTTACYASAAWHAPAWRGKPHHHFGIRCPKIPQLAPTDIGHGQTLHTPQNPIDQRRTRQKNLPDVLARWLQRETKASDNPRTAQSFTVFKDEIAATGYDLSLNRYKEVVHEQIDHIPSSQLLAELKQLDSEIQSGLMELAEMLK